MARNERAYNLAQEWVLWLDTRRFYAPPEKKNILARMSGGGGGKEPPDASITPEMVAFNLAVTGLTMKKFTAFVAVYCGYRPSPIKVLAHEGGLSSSSKYYDRAHNAAHEVLHIADRLTELSRQMRAELGY